MRPILRENARSRERIFRARARLFTRKGREEKAKSKEGKERFSWGGVKAFLLSFPRGAISPDEISPRGVRAFPRTCAISEPRRGDDCSA